MNVAEKALCAYPPATGYQDIRGDPGVYQPVRSLDSPPESFGL
jgi:hypothetical protein